ncbi:30S ribosomal protein S6 [candidate division KSB1 bacterium]|nr:30S ribosomal protein S6 [candidate division KSB1 bacterium]
MRKYETIIVIDSLLKNEEIEGIINKYERFISANGGIIDTIDRWGKRRLAYEIKKRQYGFYVLIRFEAPPAMIKQLDREYRLNEFLLRTTITKLDKKALAAIAKQPPIPSAPLTETENLSVESVGDEDLNDADADVDVDADDEQVDLEPPDEPIEPEPEKKEQTYTDTEEIS